MSLELSRPNICVACDEIVCFVLRINNIYMCSESQGPRHGDFLFEPRFVVCFSLFANIVPLAQPTSQKSHPDPDPRAEPPREAGRLVPAYIRSSP